MATTSRVEAVSVEQVEQDLKFKVAREAAARQLLQNAIGCTYYVALGNVMKKDFVEKYGLTTGEAETILARAANNLIKLMKGGE